MKLRMMMALAVRTAAPSAHLTLGVESGGFGIGSSHAAGGIASRVREPSLCRAHLKKNAKCAAAFRPSQSCFQGMAAVSPSPGLGETGVARAEERQPLPSQDYGKPASHERWYGD